MLCRTSATRPKQSFSIFLAGRVQNFEYVVLLMYREQNVGYYMWCATINGAKDTWCRYINGVRLDRFNSRKLLDRRLHLPCTKLHVLSPQRAGGVQAYFPAYRAYSRGAYSRGDYHATAPEPFPPCVRFRIGPSGAAGGSTGSRSAG